MHIQTVKTAVKDYTTQHLSCFCDSAVSNWPEFAKTWAPGSEKAPSIESAPKYGMHFGLVNRAWNAISTVTDASMTPLELCQACRDPLALFLDKKHGAAISDQAVFRDFAREWEKDFFSDMDALNVSLHILTH